MLENEFLAIRLDDNILTVNHKQMNMNYDFSWPAVTISIDNKKYIPKQAADSCIITSDKISQQFFIDGLHVNVSIRLTDNSWLKKVVEISSEQQFPTPDYVEIDSQLVHDELEICGYFCEKKQVNCESGEEEATGQVPGCGYPLIGNNLFFGLEHPAAFNNLDKTAEGEQITLRHYPIWEGKNLQQIDEVIGVSENARATFQDYLSEIRLPILNEPLISFCTFWSDPYLGDNEYRVNFEAYKAFFDMFKEFGLQPSVFTLDAGWNDRNSIFQAKKEIGGDEGLASLNQLAESMGSKLSLWLSHNGPMGIAPEFMKEKGFAVGSGSSAAYCGDGYGVMMDNDFCKALETRFCEMLDKTGVIHYKIDWDNECATNNTFDTTYPTVNHVRQASLNAYFKIGRSMRHVNPEVVIRNGWWPSPWWLAEANHTWLIYSGDSEYMSLPSKTQRDSSSTHRDFMYYNILIRDKTPLPLDCFDNHEFPDAARNPFVEEPVSWLNALWLSIFRGSTYLAYTLQPEKLENWQVESLKNVINFSRNYKDSIFTNNSKMVGGNPGDGEIYGFCMPSENQTWCLLRNPLPVPQKADISFDHVTDHDINSIWQFYPHYERLCNNNEILLAAHEVKLLVISEENLTPSYPIPYMIDKTDNNYAIHFPASASITEEVSPKIDPIQQIQKLSCLSFTKSIKEEFCSFNWFIESPYRTRELELQFYIAGNDLDKLELQALSSRYENREDGYSLAITSITKGPEGYGEKRNPLPNSVHHSRRYYSIRIPDGGSCNIRLNIQGFNNTDHYLEAWLAGYEAPSRQGITIKNKSDILTIPDSTNECLPIQHPLGFSRIIELPTDV